MLLLPLNSPPKAYQTMLLLNRWGGSDSTFGLGATQSGGQGGIIGGTAPSEIIVSKNSCG
jgi:hypothetical protein